MEEKSNFLLHFRDKVFSTFYSLESRGLSAVSDEDNTSLEWAVEMLSNSFDIISKCNRGVVRFIPLTFLGLFRKQDQYEHSRITF